NQNQDTPSQITNKGIISVKVEAPSDADKTKIKIAGIRINDGYVNLSNTGSINIESTVPGVKAHTLWIEGGNVTLKDKFAITFGTPGINPSSDNSTNLNQRPIYVTSGTLNLNNAVLIAHADRRNLKLNEKYYLIYNEGGEVEGEWGGLERGFLNFNINVSWAGEDLGANSAVMFTYEPQSEYAIMPVIGAMAATPISINMLVGVLTFSPVFSPFIVGQSDYKSLMFASSVVSDVPLRTTPVYSKGVWFVPVYTKTKAKDLGFDADSYGFSFGFGGKLTDTLYGGIFAGYLRNNLDFKTVGATDENQDIFLGGLGFTYSPNPWYVRFIASVYTANHDYTGKTGLNYELAETAEYKSRGLYNEITAGYLFGDKIKFVPELGFSYGHYKTKSFTTSVSANPSFERVYEPDSLDVFKAIAGFNLRADLNLTQIFGGLRLEQALGDNDISVISYSPGQPKYKLEKSIADTTLVIHAGLSHSISKQISFELGVRADINEDYKAYTGRGALKVAF
ncbi:MAG: autotransporter outer membrane beta-barrel domain-containing protein, partial [Thermodesulfovibrio sp.]|nr:autotransporter outer membrane beta-barrel domain-containing protein [Thermodesulfovibrio sp.]